MLRASVIGNLGADPEMKYSAGGAPFLRFNVASSFRAKDATGEWADRTEWVRCTVFGLRAEALQNHLRKGTRVFVDGRLEARPWTDQQGQVRAGLEIVADGVEFMSAQRGPDFDISDLPATSTPASVTNRDAPRARAMPQSVAVHGARPSRGGTVVARPDSDLPF